VILDHYRRCRRTVKKSEISVLVVNREDYAPGLTPEVSRNRSISSARKNVFSLYLAREIFRLSSAFGNYRCVYISLSEFPSIIIHRLICHRISTMMADN